MISRFGDLYLKGEGVHMRTKVSVIVRDRGLDVFDIGQSTTRVTSSIASIISLEARRSEISFIA
jgi:hypothetical protein